MAIPFLKALVLTIGLTGFYLTLNYYQRTWRERHDWQAELVARRKQTAARAHFYKDRYGNGFVLALALLFPCAALFLFAVAVLVPSLVFPNDGNVKALIICGNLFLAYWANHYVIKSYL